MGDVTRLLSDVESSDSGASEQLLPLVYNELRRLAAQKMAGESPDHTLQATALVHEAYMRLMDAGKAQHWDNRGHFFVAAAEAMRRILLNRAREKNRRKRGGDRRKVDFDRIEVALNTPSEDLIALDEAIQELSDDDPVCAQLVKLRFFAGLSHTEAAASLEITRRMADRQWAYARSWLYDRLCDE